MTECESRRGTAANLSLSQRWTQSQSSIATVRRKVCLCLFLICFSICGPATRSQQDPCLRFLLCLVVAPVFHGFVLLSENSMFVFLCPPPGCRSLSSVASLESPVICCLGPLIQYLREFNLERVLRSERYIAQRHRTHLTARVQSVIMQHFCRSAETERW